MRRLLISLIIIAWSSGMATAATYYLRADGTAEDKTAATSCSAAATSMSVATHNAQTFAPGDTISLCSNGGIYKAEIVPPTSGSSGNIITYSNAAGHTPILDISENFVNTGWTSEGGGVYSKTGIAARIFWVDNVAQKAATSVACSDGVWYYNGDLKIFFKPDSGTPADYTLYGLWFSSPFSAAGVFDTCINVQNKSYITITGLTFKHSGVGILHSSDNSSPESVSNITIYSNTFSECYWAIYGDALSNEISSDFLVYGNSIDYCNSGYSAWTGSTTDAGHTQHPLRHIVRNNTITNLGGLTASLLWTDACLDGSSMTDHEGISFQDSVDCQVYDNSISNSIYHVGNVSNAYWMRGFYIYLTNGATACTGNVISRNYIYGQFFSAIYISGPSVAGFGNNRFEYNVIVYPGEVITNGGLSLRFESANASDSMNYFQNNTIYSSGTSDDAWRSNAYDTSNSPYSTGYWTVRNNIFYCGARYVYLAAVDHTTPRKYVFNNNVYYGADWSGQHWGFSIGEIGDMQYSQWQALGYDASGSQLSDPLFVSIPNNMSIQSGSPAKDAGVDWGQTVDFLGVVKQGAAFDIGAYEFFVGGMIQITGGTGTITTGGSGTITITP